MPLQTFDQAQTRELLAQVISLREESLRIEQGRAAELEAVHPGFRASARNLLHYLGVRRHDIRPLQRDLAFLGLSSFGILESHVMAALNAVSARLEEMTGHPASPPAEAPADFISGPHRLQEHANSLLGEARDGREVRIMVTLPSEAAYDPVLIPSLIEAGMEIARINCAHDDAEAWIAMVNRVRDAALAQGRPCRIQADLAGPKSRTGRIRALGHLLKLRPSRDFRGRVIHDAMLWITPHDAPCPPPGTDIPSLLFQPQGLDDSLESVKPGARLELTDARGRLRTGTLIQHSPAGLLVGFDHTAYIEDGTVINVVRGRKHLLRGVLSGAPEVPEEIRLKPGDTLILTREDQPGCAGVRNPAGDMIEPARLHCTLEAAFTDARPEQRVWLDDGRIGAVISANDGQAITLTITHAAAEGSRLKQEKGINFPDTDFHAPALTAKDLADLEAMAPHVDMVALSFLRGPEDVALLQDHLTRLDANNLGIVLKIENRQAFEHLPRTLLTGMRSPSLGVMVARGDLAVEMGFERLSEVQEEILWLCEAAHVPVIWATQILESLAKNGAPSRPEVTDAAMSIRAECAMLNKGPHIVEALRFLSGVLSRMEGHYSKRMAMRRRLAIADCQ
ncbi:MAG: pyruvate kinase [Pseudomonadota bacterium]